MRLVLAAACAATIGSSSLVQADDAVARGQEFLRVAQRPGGGYAGIPILDAAEAAAVLDDPLYRDAALFALAQATPDNTEAAIARLDALVGTPYFDAVAAQAVLLAAAHGDLGLAPGWRDSDPLVLARALRFAARAPVSLTGTAIDPITWETSELSQYPAILTRVLGQLDAIQRPDGGFGFADEPSDLVPTAEVSRALAALSANATAATVLARAQTWLAAVAQGSGATSRFFSPRPTSLRRRRRRSSSGSSGVRTRPGPSTATSAAQVRLGVDAGELRGLEDRVVQGRDLGAAPRLRAVVVLPPDDNAPHPVFGGVLVERHARVVGEHGEPGPKARHVRDRLAEAALRQRARLQRPAVDAGQDLARPLAPELRRRSRRPGPYPAQPPLLGVRNGIGSSGPRRRGTS